MITRKKYKKTNQTDKIQKYQAIQQNLKSFLHNKYHYSKNKKSYNKILGLYNSIDFLIKDIEATDEEFEKIILGLEKFVNSICIVELNNYK